MSWFNKYAPKKLSDVKNQPVSDLLKYSNSNPKGKALLITGPAGTGKTCSVHALADEHGYELVEVNASTTRNAESIKEIVGNASLTKGFFGKRIILIDDVDALSGSDRGGVTELINCIKKTMTPIFLTAIDPWDSKLRTLRGYCKVLDFKKLNASSIKLILKDICAKESIKAIDSVLYSIASHANGDVRAAINNLEMLSGDGEVTEHELESMGYREKPISIFNGLQTLFKSSNFDEVIHSLDDVELDIDTKFLWILENITKEFSKPSELSKAFNYLSRADVFNGRINRRQYWRLLVYVNSLMTLGVNSSRNNPTGFIKYSNPTRILKLWGSKSIRELRKQLALKLGRRINSSINKTIREVIPFIKLLAKKTEFINDYEITAEELSVLTK